MQCVEQEVRQFVIDNFFFGDGDAEFSNGDSFMEKGLVDSLGVLNLVAFVCGKYDISIEDGELVPENWDSVRRIAMFVERKQSVKAAVQ